MKRLFHTASLVIAVILIALLVSGCSRLQGFTLPPLPTPAASNSADENPVFSDVQNQEVPENANAAPAATPEPSATPEPTQTPVPTPENPNVPHLSIYDETLPGDMPQYSVADLLGEVMTDQGEIIQVEGLITDLDGAVVQRCVYYPYEQYFNLADTVNAELRFGVLKPGKYLYQLKVIATNNSYYTDELLINHPFEIYYP